MYQQQPTPLVYRPQPLVDEHQALVLPAPAMPTTDPRRALVQLDDGRWVTAYVPAPPPVLVPAAPEAAAPRRPLTTLERGAITVVGSLCALSLSIGGALAMAGPAALAAAADLAFGAAALLGTTVAALFGVRALRPTSASTGTTPATAAPVEVTITGHGGTGGRFGSRGGTGVRINRLTINNR
ncbi:hypothetical protein ACFV2Q_27715 [Streptomyces sp. NPDC059650]|uniref:hypothetical protein n=1 Tax=Streptomyces sp. NPDC059650 TaxID=3346896 RepID=UPI003681B814